RSGRLARDGPQPFSRDQRVSCRRSPRTAGWTSRALSGSEAGVQADPVAAGFVLVVVIVDKAGGVRAVAVIQKARLVAGEVAVEQVVDPAGDGDVLVDAELRAEVEHRVAFVEQLVTGGGVYAPIAPGAMLTVQLQAEPIGCCPIQRGVGHVAGRVGQRKADVVAALLLAVGEG